MFEIRRMRPSDIERIGEIDRTQHVTQGYVFRDGRIELEDVDWRVGPWPTDGRSSDSVQANLDAWRPFVEKGGTMFGALDGDRLVGFAIYWPNLTHDTAQFAVLHVSNGHRGQGVGTALTNEVIRLAKTDGASKLYVSTTPSKPTVDFYRKRGFSLAEEVNHELYELEPEDIHMIREL